MKQETEQKILELLEDLNQKKNDEIEKLNIEINDLSNQLDYHNWQWMRHKESASDELPVPRLELRYESTNIDFPWTSYKVIYSLVYQHLLDYYVIIPMGLTKCSGGHGWKNLDLRKIDLPFREGAHINHDSQTLNLDAYIVVVPDGTIITDTYFEKIDFVERGYRKRQTADQH